MHLAVDRHSWLTHLLEGGHRCCSVSSSVALDLHLHSGEEKKEIISHVQHPYERISKEKLIKLQLKNRIQRPVLELFTNINGITENLHQRHLNAYKKILKETRREK